MFANSENIFKKQTGKNRLDSTQEQSGMPTKSHSQDGLASDNHWDGLDF